MGILNILGEVFLNSLESSAKHGANNKKIPEEMRQQYSDFGSALNNMRKDKNYKEDDDEDY